MHLFFDVRIGIAQINLEPKYTKSTIGFCFDQKHRELRKSKKEAFLK
jgi:hypothetical protein